MGAGSFPAAPRSAFPRIAVRGELIYCFDRDRITCA